MLSSFRSRPSPSPWHTPRIPHRKQQTCDPTPAAACPETAQEAPTHMCIVEEKLVADALHLPRREAARWRHTPLEQEDLVADGCVGLVKAALRYDASLDIPFTAFATPYVRGAITDSVRARARRRHLGDGTFVSIVGFADLVRADGGDEVPFEPADPGLTPHDTVECLDKLRVIGTLPDRERVALVRTIVDGDTAADVAEELGVSADRVYALVQTGSARLRRRAA
jgi:RNA polymerase primary sigma factor